MKRILPFIFTLLVSLAQAQTVTDVLTSIEQQNLQLQALRQQQQAELLDLQAANRPAPLSVEYSPFGERGYTGIAESELIVSQEFDFPTLYAARARQQALQGQVFDEQYAAARREVLLEAHGLCCDIIRINQLCAMQHQRLANIDRAIRYTEQQLASGDATLLDLNRVKLERMEVHAADAQGEAERTQLLGQLQALNGGQPVSLTDTSYVHTPYNLITSKPHHLTTSPPHHLTTSPPQNLISSQPSVRIAEAEWAAARQELSVARQSWLPSLNVGYRRNTSYHDHVDGVLLGASFPLYGSSSRMRAARLRQQSAALQLADARQQADAQCQAQLAELAQLRQVLAAFSPDLLRQTLALLSAALDHGQISAVQYHTEASDIYQRFETYITLCCQCAKLECIVGQ